MNIQIEQLFALIGRLYVENQALSSLLQTRGESLPVIQAGPAELEQLAKAGYPVDQEES